MEGRDELRGENPRTATQVRGGALGEASGVERDGADKHGPDFDRLVQEDRLHRSIYTEEAIFDLEMRNIYEGTWVCVGHESEIANIGDYKTCRIGRQPVIVTRDRDGEIRVLVNRCLHRGSVVCREKRGNSNFFRCPYHGWTYKNTGELVGVPRRKRYPEDFDLHELDMFQLPKVGSYRGLIFASFNAEVEDLVTHLGPTIPYIDTVMDFSVDGEISLEAGSNRLAYPGNWKFEIENGVDGYHAMFLHDSFFKMLARDKGGEHTQIAPQDDSRGRTVAFPNGHALLTRKPAPGAHDRFRGAYPKYAARLEQKHGRERAEELLDQINLFVFPNLYLVLNQMRVIQPISVTETVVDYYPIQFRGAPDTLNSQRLREHEEGFAPTGFVGTDDYEAYVCVQEGLQGSSVPWLVLKRGIDEEQVLEDGTRIGQPSDETTQRGIYRHYKRVMLNGRAE